MGENSLITSHYPFDSNANDIVGGKNGVETAVTFWTGKIGDAAYIDIGSSIIVNDDPSSLSVGAVSVWVMFPSVADPWFPIFDHSTLDYTKFLTLEMEVDGLWIFAYNEDGYIAEEFLSDTPFDEWLHIVFMSDGVAWSLYMNGKQVALSGLGDNPGTWFDLVANSGTSRAFGIGSYASGTQYFQGAIDQFLVFNAPLSESQIVALYNAGNGTDDLSFLSPYTYQAITTDIDAARIPQNVTNYLSGAINAQAKLSLPLAAELNQSDRIAMAGEIFKKLLQPMGDEANQAGILAMGTEACLALLIGMGLEPVSKLILQIGVFGQLFQTIRNQLTRGDHAEAVQSVVNGLVSEIHKVQAVITSSSDALSRLQAVLTTLSRGDYAAVQQAVLSGLVVDIRNVQGLINGLHDGVSVVESLCLMLSRGDHISAQQSVIDGLIADIRNHQSLKIELSGSIEKLQSIRDSLSRGDHVSAQQAIIDGLTFSITKLLSLKMELSDGLISLQKSMSTISGDPANQFQAVINEFLLTNDIHAFQKTLTALADIPAVFYSTVAEVYLDGRPLSSRVTSPITITVSEANVHNMISFSSADPELFAWCDPLLMPDSVRIEAQIGARMMQFIIIARPGESIDFTVTGISVSDFEDGLADDISFSLTTPTLASEIVASLTNYCPVDWQAFDWIVPAGFSFSGKPLDGIQTLAAEIGAIVRCADDGSLIVRAKRPVRPVDMPFAAPAVSYDESTVIDLTPSEEEASGYNAVEVAGRQSETEAPMLEREETFDGHTPEPGETVRVRVYWGGMNPDVADTYVTAGEMALLDGGQMHVQAETDVFVEFKDGKGSVAYPISRLVSYEWEGYPASEITYNVNGKELFIPDPGFAVAKIKYESQYQRYELTNHAVDMLIAVLFLNVTPSVYAAIRTEDDAKYGSAISAPLLTTNAAAVARGTAYIDENKYPKSNLAITAPYNDLALDGSVAWLHDSRIGSPGNHHIKTANIIIDGPMVTNALELEKCLIS